MNDKKNDFGVHCELVNKLFKKDLIQKVYDKIEYVTAIIIKRIMMAVFLSPCVRKELPVAGPVDCHMSGKSCRYISNFQVYSDIYQ